MWLVGLGLALHWLYIKAFENVMSRPSVCIFLYLHKARHLLPSLYLVLVVYELSFKN